MKRTIPKKTKKITRKNQKKLQKQRKRRRRKTTKFLWLLIETKFYIQFFECTTPISNYTTIIDCMRTNLRNQTIKDAVSENKGVLHCEGCDCEEFLGDNMETPLLDLF